MNWLTLCILGISDRSLPVLEVVYDDEENLDFYLGEARGDTTRVAIPAACSHAGAEGSKDR